MGWIPRWPKKEKTSEPLPDVKSLIPREILSLLKSRSFVEAYPFCEMINKWKTDGQSMVFEWVIEFAKTLNASQKDELRIIFENCAAVLLAHVDVYYGQLMHDMLGYPGATRDLLKYQNDPGLLRKMDDIAPLIVAKQSVYRHASDHAADLMIVKRTWDLLVAHKTFLA